MARSTYYKTCADCGANLDPQETCDCHRQPETNVSAHECVGAGAPRNMLDEYKWHLTASGAAPNTVRTYVAAVERLQSHLLYHAGIDISNGIGLPLVTAEHLRTYYDSLLAEEKKRSTRNLFASGIRSYFGYHRQQEHIKNNPTIVLPHAKAKYGEADIRPDEEQFYTMAEVREILLYFRQNLPKKTKKRDLALFTLLCASAMRINEACFLNIRDMDTIRKGSVYVVGKGGNAELVNIADYAVPYLDAYLGTRPNVSPTDPLFLSQKKRRLTPNAAWKAFARFQIPMSMSTGTHICRHTALTHIAHKAGIVTARDAGRHKQTSTTNRYVHRLDDLVQEAANTTPIAEAFEEVLLSAS